MGVGVEKGYLQDEDLSRLAQRKHRRALTEISAVDRTRKLPDHPQTLKSAKKAHLGVSQLRLVLRNPVPAASASQVSSIDKNKRSL